MKKRKTTSHDKFHSAIGISVTKASARKTPRVHYKITEEEKHEENKITTLVTLAFYWRAHYPSTKRVHYWVEEFAYRHEINTTKVLANDSTEKVSVISKL